MTLGPVMLDVEGIELTQEDKELLQHPSVGGVILFSRNFEGIEQLEILTREIRSARNDNLLIAVDHEGGRVQRFIEGFTRLPAVRRFGEYYDHNSKGAKQLAQDAAWLMAVELRSVGVDFSFAPVVDLDYGLCEVIGDRAFHCNPKIVYELAHAYCHGMEEAGMASVAKHFPGHGAVEEDSHLAVPVDSREFEELYQKDILPFRLLIQDNLAAIMPAHIIYEKVDTHPAGFSSFWLKKVLRQRLNFTGVIFSDDLNMHGASVAGNNYSDRALAALNAGCDMVLICNNRPAATEIVETINGHIDPISVTRLARMHGRHEISRQALHKMQKWHQVSATMQKYLDDPNLELEL
jgi:beta-N-acetylhexosaminidase